MLLRKVFIMICVIPLVVLMGCGKQDRELVVGNYTDDQTIVYSEDRMTDEEKIEDFKTAIETSSTTDERPEGLPQYVVTINNPAESTMELMVNFWENDNNELIFTKGLEGSDYFKVNEDSANEIKELLN